MVITLSIDPGTTESAFVVWDGEKLHASGFVSNLELLREIETAPMSITSPFSRVDQLDIEMVACYGMPVGKEVFETCVWIGQFLHAGLWPSNRVYRKDVKIHLCGSMKAKDGNIRQALIDKHGRPGTKKNPGKLYGISGHLWAALAVADYALSQPQL